MQSEFALFCSVLKVSNLLELVKVESHSVDTMALAMHTFPCVVLIHNFQNQSLLDFSQFSHSDFLSVFSSKKNVLTKRHISMYRTQCNEFSCVVSSHWPLQKWIYILCMGKVFALCESSCVLLNY